MLLDASSWYLILLLILLIHVHRVPLIYWHTSNELQVLWFSEHNQGGIRQQCGLSCCSWESDGLWCALTGDHSGQTSSHRRDTGTASPQSGTAGDGTAHLSEKTCNTHAHRHTELSHAGKAVALQTTTNMIYPTLIGFRLSPKTTSASHLPILGIINM